MEINRELGIDLNAIEELERQDFDWDRAFDLDYIKEFSEKWNPQEVLPL